jgi:hypothetical protein
MKTTFLAALAIIAGLAVGAPPLASAEEQPASPPNMAAKLAPLTTSGFVTKTYSVIVNVNGACRRSLANSDAGRAGRGAAYARPAIGA